MIDPRECCFKCGEYVDKVYKSSYEYIGTVYVCERCLKKDKCNKSFKCRKAI